MCASFSSISTARRSSGPRSPLRTPPRRPSPRASDARRLNVRAAKPGSGQLFWGEQAAAWKGSPAPRWAPASRRPSRAGLRRAKLPAMGARRRWRTEVQAPAAETSTSLQTSRPQAQHQTPLSDDFGASLLASSRSPTAQNPGAFAIEKTRVATPWRTSRKRAIVRPCTSMTNAIASTDPLAGSGRWL